MTAVPARGICIRFWYNSFGSQQGQLNLLERVSFESNSMLVYTLRPNLDVDWREAIIYRPNMGSYQFFLEAIVGNVTAGSYNIAIDDITSNEGMLDKKDIIFRRIGFCFLGPCPTQKFCDFESPDICGYVYDQSGNFNWTRHQGQTSSATTGPPYDHTTFTSQGMIVEYLSKTSQ